MTLHPLEVLPPDIPGFPNLFQLLWTVVVAIAAWVLGQLLVPLFRAVAAVLPGFLHWIGDRANDAARGVENWALGQVGHVISALVSLFQLTEMVGRALAASLTHAIESAWNAVAYIAHVSIPFLQAQLQQAVDALRAYVNQQLGGAIHALQLALQSIYDALLRYTAEHFGAAIAAAANFFHQAERDIGLVWAAATAAIAGAFTASTRYTDQRVRQAEQAAGAEADAVRQQAGVADRALREYLDQQIRGAEGLSSTLIGNAERSLGLQLQNSMAQALAASAAVAVAVDAIRELECIKQCNPLGQLGNDLQALDLGILLAILLGAAAHPQEGAAALTDLLLPGGQLFAQQLQGMVAP